VRGHLPVDLPRCFLRLFSFPFDAFIERFVSYLKMVPGEPGQKDVLDV